MRLQCSEHFKKKCSLPPETSYKAKDKHCSFKNQYPNTNNFCFVSPIFFFDPVRDSKTASPHRGMCGEVILCIDRRTLLLSIFHPFSRLGEITFEKYTQWAVLVRLKTRPEQGRKNMHLFAYHIAQRDNQIFIFLLIAKVAVALRAPRFIMGGFFHCRAISPLPPAQSHNDNLIFSRSYLILSIISSVSAILFTLSCCLSILCDFSASNFSRAFDFFLRTDFLSCEMIISDTTVFSSIST